VVFCPLSFEAKQRFHSFNKPSRNHNGFVIQPASDILNISEPLPNPIPYPYQMAAGNCPP
jgi:hypothetical protein